MWQQLANAAQAGDKRALARLISMIENNAEGCYNFLKTLPEGKAMVTGITGPPGAGKSTLVNALLHKLNNNNIKTAVLCVDPSSPFHLGALLGDRIRMNEWYNNDNINIRSLASRGNLGGLHPRIIEITDLLKFFFDAVIIETVGVGQSEIDIAALADFTVLVLVPEAGDEIQAMKAGIIEIADAFVVNKADRPGADMFIKNLLYILSDKKIPVIKTAATTNEGIDKLFDYIKNKPAGIVNEERKLLLKCNKIYQLVQQQRMSNISKKVIEEAIKKADNKNIYAIAESLNKE